VGQGTYSSVYKAVDQATGGVVALKKVRLDVCDEEAVLFAIREVLALRRIEHPNVLKLLALAVPPHGNDSALYLVLEFHPHDLAGALASRASQGFAALPEAAAKSYVCQLLAALAACHAAGVIHRDVKCSNLLIADDGRLVLGDLGLAALLEPHSAAPAGQPATTAFDSPPRGPGVAPLTNRVITLWYRPPELLLGETVYGPEVDLWSAGCIAAELHTGQPLLPGRTEVEQLHRIFKMCGSDGTRVSSNSGTNCDGVSASLAPAPGAAYPRVLADHLERCGAPPSAVALIDGLLSMDPQRRGSAEEALHAPYFHQEPLPLPPSLLPRYPAGSHELAMRRKRAAATARGSQLPGNSVCTPLEQRPPAAHKPHFGVEASFCVPMHQVITPPALSEVAPRRMSVDCYRDPNVGGRGRVSLSSESGSDDMHGLRASSLDLVILPKCTTPVTTSHEGVAMDVHAHYEEDVRPAAMAPFAFG